MDNADRAAKTRSHGPGRNISLVPTAPPALKAHQLFQEARSVSVEHLRSLQAAIAMVREMSIAVVEGGDLYAPGLHDFAGRLSEDLFWRSKTLEMLSQRQLDVVSSMQQRGPSPPSQPAKADLRVDVA
jgi:hypothetical protein